MLSNRDNRQLTFQITHGNTATSEMSLKSTEFALWHQHFVDKILPSKAWHRHGRRPSYSSSFGTTIPGPSGRWAPSSRRSSVCPAKFALRAWSPPRSHRPADKDGRGAVIGLHHKFCWQHLRSQNVKSASLTHSQAQSVYRSRPQKRERRKTIR